MTSILSLNAPAAILDLAVVEANCQRMLDTVRRLGVAWRPHIKTHKVGLAVWNIV
jgi:D-serine deaminase-like pyridoxal phosphate-dependent protein